MSFNNQIANQDCVLLKACESESEVAQSCQTLCDPMDCSLPGSCVHGIFKARVLEWVAISFSRGSSRPRGRTWESWAVGRRFHRLSHQGSPVTACRAGINSRHSLGRVLWGLQRSVQAPTAGFAFRMCLLTTTFSSVWGLYLLKESLCYWRQGHLQFLFYCLSSDGRWSLQLKTSLKHFTIWLNVIF